MINLGAYMQFMGISTFPQFEIEYFEPDLNKEYTSFAQAVYDRERKKHTLMLPSRETPQFLLYHELTHMYDMERFKTGEMNYDFCLTGFMEYHASQVELMVMMGAGMVDDNISFSMNDSVNSLDLSVHQYLNSKLVAAGNCISDSTHQIRLTGLGVFYNFLGLKSVCNMYSTDFIDDFDCRKIVDRLSSILFFDIRQYMTGWITDVDKTVALYSHAVNAVTIL